MKIKISEKAYANDLRESFRNGCICGLLAGLAFGVLITFGAFVWVGVIKI